MKTFINATVYVEGEGLKKCNLAFDQKIVSIGEQLSDAEVISLPDDAIVLPGFIDQHIHGAGSFDTMDGNLDALKGIAQTVATEGTTEFLATTMTQSPENIKKALSAVCEYKKANPDDGAEILGVHLEGPFIAPEHKGAQPLEYVATPDVDVFDEYNNASGNCIKIVTIAPEREGADRLIKHLDSKGIIPSIGHSGAKTADVKTAIDNGAKNVTHTFNAQTALHHREIGVVGSAMLFDQLNCEMIADCIHVSIPAMQLLIKSKPLDKLTLITDAMRAKGMPDGESELGGQVVIVKNGEARLKDGVLAGSVLKMNVAISNLVNKVGVPLIQAIDYATANPAKNLGIYDSVGSIKVGKKANFAVLDKDFNVLMTIRNGKIIYQK